MRPGAAGSDEVEPGRYRGAQRLVRLQHPGQAISQAGRAVETEVLVQGAVAQVGIDQQGALATGRQQQRQVD